MFRDVRGRRFHVVDAGAADGPVMVAVGGWVGSWEMWLDPIAELSATMRVVAFDHRGAGETPLGDPPPGLDDLVDDLIAIMDECGVERALLGGESHGATVALKAALDHPDRVEALVLVAGSAVQPTLPPEIVQATAEGLRTNFDATLRSIVEIGLPEDSVGHLKRWAYNILFRAGPEAAAALLTALDGTDLSPRLEELSLPVAVVHGRNDMMVPFERGVHLAETLPGGRLVALDGVGHVPTLSRPHVVVDVVRNLVSHAAP